MSLGGPAPPDPTQVANATQGYNTAAGTASQAGSLINQVTPYGTIDYSQRGTGPGGVPLYTGTATLSPAQQQLLDTLQGTQKTAGNQASTLLTNANYGAENPADVIGGMTSGTTKDLLSKEVSYLDTFYQTQTSQLDSKLRNQGLQPGTTGYDNAMRGLTNTQNLGVTNFLAQAEPEAYRQATSSYMLPLNMTAQEMGLSLPSPTGINATSAPTTPLNVQSAGPTYASTAQSNYAQQVAANNAMMSGLFGIPSAILGGWARGGGMGSMFGGAGAGGVDPSGMAAFA